LGAAAELEGQSDEGANGRNKDITLGGELGEYIDSYWLRVRVAMALWHEGGSVTA